MKPVRESTPAGTHLYPPCINPRVDGLLPVRVRVRVELWAPTGVPVPLPNDMQTMLLSTNHTI